MITMETVLDFQKNIDKKKNLCETRPSCKSVNFVFCILYGGKGVDAIIDRTVQEWIPVILVVPNENELGVCRWQELIHSTHIGQMSTVIKQTGSADPLYAECKYLYKRKYDK